MAAKKPQKLSKLFEDNMEKLENPKTDGSTLEFPENEDIMGYREMSNFEFRQHPGYMYWEITAKRGKLPQPLEGYWTHIEDAKRAVKLYLGK